MISFHKYYTHFDEHGTAKIFDIAPLRTNGHITVNPPSIQNVALLDGRAVLLIRNPFEAAVSAFTHWEGNSGHSLSVAP